jgi:hypothetical protein
LSVDPARLAEGLRYVEVAKSRYRDDTYMARVMYGETSSMVFEMEMLRDGGHGAPARLGGRELLSATG